MGMFDYVEFSAPCPKCGEMVSEWQTKNTDCRLETVYPFEAIEFGISCPSCGESLSATFVHQPPVVGVVWVEAVETEKLTAHPYKMEVIIRKHEKDLGY